MGVYLVTGAASGIGLATTKVLAGDGHQRLRAGPRRGRLATAFDGLEGPQPNALIADVADPASVAAALAASRSRRPSSMVSSTPQASFRSCRSRT